MAPTPITNWDEADLRLASVSGGSYVEAMCRVRVEAEVTIWLARAFWHWRQVGAKPPAKIRVIRFGDVVVEWTSPEAFVFVGQGLIEPHGPVLKHGLTLPESPLYPLPKG